MKPPIELALAWEHELVFTAAAGELQLVTDGNGRQAFSPVQLLAVAIAGCMATDVVHILGKARQPVAALTLRFRGERAQAEPHRFTHVRLAFDIEGQVTQPQLDRALQLSRDKYCSVWNSLREDTGLEIETSIRVRA